MRERSCLSGSARPPPLSSPPPPLPSPSPLPPLQEANAAFREGSEAELAQLRVAGAAASRAARAGGRAFGMPVPPAKRRALAAVVASREAHQEHALAASSPAPATALLPQGTCEELRAQEVALVVARREALAKQAAATAAGQEALQQWSADVASEQAGATCLPVPQASAALGAACLPVGREGEGFHYMEWVPPGTLMARRALSGWQGTGSDGFISRLRQAWEALHLSIRGGS